MRRRRASFRKEKAIMLASSCLVLGALTVTGLYVRNSVSGEEESNIVDFTALEEDGVASAEDGTAGEAAGEVVEGELDYDPSFQEANSGNVDNPGLNMLGSTAGDADLAAQTEEADVAAAENLESQAADAALTADASDAGEAPEDVAAADEEQAAAAEEEQALLEEEEVLAANADEALVGEGEEEEAMNTSPVLDFTESDTLVWPIVGNVLVNYSMDKTVYFATLQQYKYSPAIVIAATEGEGIAAAADGQVTSVYEDPQTGTTVVMNLGDGYELTYGQMTDLTVAEGDIVTTGEIIGRVAAPTRYYSVEGSNVYFKLTKDGEPVNPLNRLS